MAIVIGFAHLIPQFVPGMGLLSSALFGIRQIFDAPFFPSVAQDVGTFQPSLRPILFERFSPGDDFKVFHATCRRDLRFSDGSALVSADIARAFSREFGAMGTCETWGDELTFRLSKPNSRFELFLSGGPFITKESHGGLIGTGKFCLREHRPGQVTLEPNGFHPQKATESLVFRSYTDNDSLVAALGVGEVDLAPSLSWPDLAKLQGVSKLTRPVNSTASLYFNTQSLDVEFRRTLASVVDRRAIATAATRGQGPLEAMAVLPLDFGPFPSLDFFAPSRARHGALRFNRPLRVAAMFGPRPYLPDPAAALAELIAQLEVLGLKVVVTQPTTPDAYQRLAASGDYDILVTGNVADSDDPVEFLASLFGSEAVPTLRGAGVGRCNFSRIADERLDAALDRCRAQRNSESFHALNEVLRSLVPLIPVTHGRAIMAHQYTLKNVVPGMTSVIDMSVVQIRTRARSG